MTAETVTKEFRTETKKILDIVINSLYTERDIFVRELVSNAADALEKFRHLQLTRQPEFDSHLDLEITIDCDDKRHRLTITDTGVGMTREELERNLGTIAHSGSSRFLEELAEAAKKDVNLIGQFGVGFYSVFMAAKKVTVQTRSWDGSEGHQWESDGLGSYTISPCPGLHRGTRIIIDLKEDAHEYAHKFTIERIIEQYSSFVPFPIKVEGKTVNTIEPLWTKSKEEISDKQYTEFYRFVGGAMDEPMYRLHFTADAPLAIRALLFVPSDNLEIMGLGRIQSGVSLYCQRVLIEHHSEHILPEWLRFLKGVVDSDDLPLNISRQALQDHGLMVKLRRILTKRFLRFLAEEAGRDPDRYATFYRKFGVFLKEGITGDFQYREELAELLRFESSKSKPGELVSLADYVGRMREGQDAIYYINGPSREAIEHGPYVELFRRRDVEILYTTEPIDDFVLNHLGEYKKKKLVSADRADLRLPGAKEAQRPPLLDEDAVRELCSWLRRRFGDRVHDVVPSSRLVDSPAMLVNVDGMLTSSMERILRATAPEQPLAQAGKKNLEINPASPLIAGLDALRRTDEEMAAEVAEQIYSGAMVQAGLLLDPRDMVARGFKLLERLLAGRSAADESGGADLSAEEGDRPQTG